MMFGLGKFSTKKLAFILCLVVFLVYANCLFNGFVWDDEEQIVNNLAVQDLRNAPLLFRGSTFNTGGAGLSGWYYKPLMSLSFMVNYWLWGGSSFGFHLFQVGLHVVNTLLVFLILIRLFNIRGYDGSCPALSPKKTHKGPLLGGSPLKRVTRRVKNSLILSFLLAFIWGIHPVSVEAVAYISATQEVLYSFFVLFAFWVILKKVRGSVIIAGFLFFLGLLAKEAALVGGVVILLYLFLFERERFLLGLGVFSLSLTGYVWLRIGVAGIPFGHYGIVPIAKASFGERFLTVPWEFFSYLRLVFWPQVLAICQHFVVRKAELGNFWLPLGVDLGFLGVLCFLGFKLRSRVFWFFAFWFLGGIGLVLNIFPLDMSVAERWLYFPMIGFLGSLGCLVSRGVNRIPPGRWKIWGVSLVGLSLILLSARTVKRTFDWRNGLTLFSHDIGYSHDAFDLENNLGVELFRVGKIEEAKTHFEKSIELQPKWWFPYNNLGAVYQRKGDLRKAEELYRKAIENGDYYLAYENLAGILLKQERWDEAAVFLEEAVRKFPENEWMREWLEGTGEKLK
jgi:hypothetical protein